MVTANDPRVVAFYNFVQAKPKNDLGYWIGSTQNETGMLYVMGGDSPKIQVWLPADLLDYANAAAGSSGDRAVGIRVGGFTSVYAVADEVQRIFSSPENLARFINSSECDYAAWHATRQSRKAPKTPMAKTEFWNRYNKETLAQIVAEHGKDRVREAYDTMTMDQFEQEFMQGVTV